MVAMMPFSCFEFSLSRCAPLMEAPNSSPSGWWHEAHALSSACAPAGWFLPLAQSMSSWQEPHAARLGLVYQTFDCVGLSAPSWQVSQLRTSCGNVMAEKSWTDCALPMIMYGVPAFTLGRFGPLWILWIMTLKSTVLPVSGSVVCGW